MHSKLFSRLYSSRFLVSSLALVVSWVVGTGAGFLLFQSSEHVFVSLMCGSSRNSVSIVMQLAGIFLPFLITAYVVYSNNFHILFPLCCVKAFAYCLAVCTVYGTYGNGGWLMQLFLLFTENVSVWLLILTWFRILTGGKGVKVALLRFGLFVLGILGLDMAFVSPFVVSFMSL